MKKSNPINRYSLKINKNEKVLEVGGGHCPHPRANVVVDKFVDSDYHRSDQIYLYKRQKFLQADGENLPFQNKEFDYIICNQVLENTSIQKNPIGGLSLRLITNWFYLIKAASSQISLATLALYS
jgi:hypothetical protein